MVTDSSAIHRILLAQGGFRMITDSCLKASCLLVGTEVE